MSPWRSLALVLAAVLAPVLALLAIPSLAEASSVTCGSHLINDGDNVVDLRRYCGEPSNVDRHSILRPPYIWHHGRRMRVAGGDLEVQVEIWTYNLGPNKLMRRITLEDGVVTDIEMLGYGHR